MADPDPPHKIDDGECPGYRDVDPPNASASIEQIADRDTEQKEHGENDREAGQPKLLPRMFERNTCNLVAYRVIGFLQSDHAGRKPQRCHRVGCALDYY